MRTYRIVHRPWKATNYAYALMSLELLGLIPILVLFGLAQPDLYRSNLWQIGWENRFNSNPAIILYAYANHRPLPTIPFVWSKDLTNFNVAISIISLFFLLAKMIGYIMKVYFPIIGTFVSTALVALYVTSVYGQMGPDYADPRYPSRVAWYISKGCSYAKPFGLTKSCQMAQGTFAATVYLLFIYLICLGIAIWSMIPDKRIDQIMEEEDEEEFSKAHKQWEMQPQTPREVPFTPRTQAFHTLDRKLPLRSNYA